MMRHHSILLLAAAGGAAGERTSHTQPYVDPTGSAQPVGLMFPIGRRIIPTGEQLFCRWPGIDGEQIGERFEIRRERYNPTDIEIAVCPGVETVTNARHERIINARMTEAMRLQRRCKLR